MRVGVDPVSIVPTAPGLLVWRGTIDGVQEAVADPWKVGRLII